MNLTKSTFLLDCLVVGLSSTCSLILLLRSNAYTKLPPFQGRPSGAAGNTRGDDYLIKY